MKLLQLVRIIARVLLLMAGTGVAAVGALQFGPKGCAGRRVSCLRIDW